MVCQDRHGRALLTSPSQQERPSRIAGLSAKRDVADRAATQAGQHPEGRRRHGRPGGPARRQCPVDGERKSPARSRKRGTSARPIGHELPDRAADATRPLALPAADTAGVRRHRAQACARSGEACAGSGEKHALGRKEPCARSGRSVRLVGENRAPGAGSRRRVNASRAGPRSGRRPRPGPRRPVHRSGSASPRGCDSSRTPPALRRPRSRQRRRGRPAGRRGRRGR